MRARHARSSRSAVRVWCGFRALAPNSLASERPYQCTPDLRSPRTLSWCRSPVSRRGRGRGLGVGAAMECVRRALADVMHACRCPPCALRLRLCCPRSHRRELRDASDRCRQPVVWAYRVGGAWVMWADMQCTPSAACGVRGRAAGRCMHATAGLTRAWQGRADSEASTYRQRMRNRSGRRQ
jgi:hypothetical protein